MKEEELIKHACELAAACEAFRADYYTDAMEVVDDYLAQLGFNPDPYKATSPQAWALETFCDELCAAWDTHVAKGAAAAAFMMRLTKLPCVFAGHVRSGTNRTDLWTNSGWTSMVALTWKNWSSS